MKKRSDWFLIAFAIKNYENAFEFYSVWFSHLRNQFCLQKLSCMCMISFKIIIWFHFNLGMFFEWTTELLAFQFRMIFNNNKYSTTKKPEMEIYTVCESWNMRFMPWVKINNASWILTVNLLVCRTMNSKRWWNLQFYWNFCCYGIFMLPAA